MKRRRDYRYRIHQSNYFIVRALQGFLSEAISRWVRPGHRVADIGCGEAPLRARIENAGGSYLGLDIQKHDSGSVAAIASVEAIPLRSAWFDVVICTEVLEHVADVPRSVREIARVLKPGGIAIVTTPFMFPLHEEPHDFGRPTRYALEKYCRDAGLEIQSLQPLGDEMQAIGILLDNTWTQMTLPGAAHQLWRVARTGLRTGGNLLFQCLSVMLKPALPHKSYLGHALIARKAEIH